MVIQTSRMDSEVKRELSTAMVMAERGVWHSPQCPTARTRYSPRATPETGAVTGRPAGTAAGNRISSGMAGSGSSSAIPRSETFSAHAAPYASKPAPTGGGNVGSVTPDSSARP